MNENKVNPSPGYSITDRKPGSAGEGLRLLARMIARRLVKRKSDANVQCHHRGLPAGIIGKKADSQSPGRAGSKQAASPSGCRLDIPDALTEEEGSDA